MPPKPKKELIEKKIGLITKAIELGLVKKIKHPVTNERVLLVGEEPKTDEWEELEDFANNRRNIKLKLDLNAKALSSANKQIEEMKGVQTPQYTEIRILKSQLQNEVYLKEEWKRQHELLSKDFNKLKSQRDDLIEETRKEFIKWRREIKRHPRYSDNYKLGLVRAISRCERYLEHLKQNKEE